MWWIGWGSGNSDHPPTDFCGESAQKLTYPETILTSKLSLLVLWNYERSKDGQKLESPWRLCPGVKTEVGLSLGLPSNESWDVLISGDLWGLGTESLCFCHMGGKPHPAIQPHPSPWRSGGNPMRWTSNFLSPVFACSHRFSHGMGWSRP